MAVRDHLSPDISQIEPGSPEWYAYQALDPAGLNNTHGDSINNFDHGGAKASIHHDSGGSLNTSHINPIVDDRAKDQKEKLLRDQLIQVIWSGTKHDSVSLSKDTLRAIKEHCSHRDEDHEHTAEELVKDAQEALEAEVISEEQFEEVEAFAEQMGDKRINITKELEGDDHGHDHGNHNHGAPAPVM